MEEHAAGTIVVKKIENVWNVLLILDMHNNWTFPKGKIEKGETPIQAALRETFEETGIDQCHSLATLKKVQYIFTRNTTVIHKTVHYFLCTTASTQEPVPQQEEGIQEASWKPLDEIKQLLGYPKTNTPLLDEIETILRSL